MLMVAGPVAARQLGLVTNEQLRALGLTAAQMQWQVKRGAIVLVRPHVYRFAGARVTWEQTVLAVALSAGGAAVISDTTAAAVWNLRHSDRNATGLHVTDTRQIRRPGVVSHRRRLSPGERTVFQAIPVTTPERTIIDLASFFSEKQLSQCLDDAIRRDLVSLERLRRLVTHVAPAPGRLLLTPVHQVLADRIPGYRPDDSHFETEMNRMGDRLGLPPAARQHRVVVEGHKYRLDRAIVEYKIAAEWDSHRHHSDPSDRDYDSNRRARLVADGWIVIPVTTNSEPELVARAVLRAYQDRGGPAG
jgi:very-short-patch-repair endonuclease